MKRKLFEEGEDLTPRELDTLETTSNLILSAALLLSDLVEELISKGKEQGSKE